MRITSRSFIRILACGLSLSAVTASLCCDDAPHSTANLPAPSAAAQIILPATRPGEVECHWAPAPVNVDGAAAERAWSAAHLIAAPSKAAPTGAPAATAPVDAAGARAPAAAARLLWDREHLYLSATIPFAESSSAGRADTLLIDIKPASDKPGFYRLTLRSDGNRPRAAFISGSEHDVEGASIPINIKFHRDAPAANAAWSFEASIRWLDFARTGGRPAVDEVWQIAIARASANDAANPDAVHRALPFAPIRFTQPIEDKPFGIATRPEWKTSHVVGHPEPPLPYTVKQVFTQLKLKQALCILPEPGSDDLLVAQHLGGDGGPGKLFRVKNDYNVDTAQVLLDINRLVYAFAFHPDYIHNGYLYVHSNGPSGTDHRQDRISRFTVDRKPPHGIDTASEQVILEWDSNGHDGGGIAFGPDGMLYFTSGDGTSDSDGNLRGQDVTHLTAAALRIDVDHPDAGRHYSIPKDNPFLKTPRARPEIYAFGFRNPWRMAWDFPSRQLWVGNNGQDAWETAYLVHPGDNFGWSVMEGSHEFYDNRERGPAPIALPTIEHPHSEFRSLTGGLVYRGDKFPDLIGAYIYGDYSTGRIWAARHDGTKLLSDVEIARTTLQIVGFGLNTNGDLFVLDDQSGICILEPAPKSADARAFPQRLSETGIFTSTSPLKPDPGLIPYTVNAPLWSDGAEKQRYIALPGESKITPADARGWEFTDGACLVKTFSLQLKENDPASLRKLETRVFTRQLGQWYGYTYIWNDDQTDATLAPAAGVDRDFTVVDDHGLPRSQTWHFPSRAECMMCHTRAANFVLGVNELQLNRDYDYGGLVDNQIRNLEHLGVLSMDYFKNARQAQNRKDGSSRYQGDFNSASGQRQAPAAAIYADDPATHPRLADPADEKAPLQDRARAYLQGNCAICHVVSGGGNSQIDFEITTPLDKAKVLDVTPIHDLFDIQDARIIAPGDPARSVLVHRLQIRGKDQMPPLGSNVSDQKAIALMQRWITNLGGKPREGPAAKAPPADAPLAADARSP